jgi:hypothetical protein
MIPGDGRLFEPDHAQWSTTGCPGIALPERRADLCLCGAYGKITIRSPFWCRMALRACSLPTLGRWSGPPVCTIRRWSAHASIRAGSRPRRLDEGRLSRLARFDDLPFGRLRDPGGPAVDRPARTVNVWRADHRGRFRPSREFILRRGSPRWARGCAHFGSASCCQRATTPASAAPRIGASQNSQSCPI